MDGQEDVRFLRAATESEAGAGEVRESKFSDPRDSRSKPGATSTQIFRVLFAARSFFGAPRALDSPSLASTIRPETRVPGKTAGDRQRD